MKFLESRSEGIEKFIRQDLPKGCLSICVLIVWGLGIDLLSSKNEHGWWIGPILLLIGFGAIWVMADKTT